MTNRKKNDFERVGGGEIRVGNRDKVRKRKKIKFTMLNKIGRE